MKYTIEGFDQNLLVKWGLDSNDTLILRWFVDFYHSGKMAKVEHDGETFLWVNYQTCIDDLPIMRITNKQVIARHFKKFVNCGLMKHHLSKDGGVYTCFKLIESEYSKLIENIKSSQPLDSKVDRGQLKSQGGIDSKVETKDSSIKDSSIKSNIYIEKNNKFKKPTVNEITAYCKERKNSIDPEYFYDYQESRGWILSNGKKMKDWQATIRTWEKNDYNKKSSIPEFSEAG